MSPPREAAAATSARAEPADRAAEKHRVEYEKTGESFETDPDNPVLDAGLAAGIDMDHGCRVGVCGACAVDVVEGIANVVEPDPIETDTIGRYELGPATRLACRMCVRGPVRLKPTE